MTKKTFLTALFLTLGLSLAVPASAEIVSYGYGSSYGAYGSTTYGAYPYYGTGYPGSYAGTSMTISRDLTVGSYGSDVQALESFLRARGYLTTSVASSGYFTVATRDAVARFQAANGIFPASGYFGPVTRAYYNAQQGSVLGISTQYPYGGYPYGTMYPYSYQDGCPSGTDPVYYYGQLGCVSDDDDDDDDNDLDGGSADIDDFRFTGLDTSLREGEDGAAVARARFEVDGGDVRVEEVSFRFESVGGSRSSDRPWEVFDRVRLLCDGDEVQEMDTDSSGDWSRDGGGYVVRLDDLDDCVVDEGDRAELDLEVDVANDVDGADDSYVRWEIAVEDDGIRVEDGDGDDHEIGDDGDVVSVTITD